MPKQSKPVSFPLRISHEVERLFDEIIHKPWGLARELEGWNPSVDLYETADAYVLEADLPGVKGEDVKVEVEGNDLILQGRRLLERTRTDGKFFYQERSFGDFLRRMQLPESVDKNAISAEFRDGVLRVTLPKVKEKEKP
jgi:HSP20 family protein